MIKEDIHVSISLEKICNIYIYVVSKLQMSKILDMGIIIEIP